MFTGQTENMLLHIMHQFTPQHLNIIRNKFPMPCADLILHVVSRRQRSRIILHLQDAGLLKQRLYGLSYLFCFCHCLFFQICKHRFILPVLRIFLFVSSPFIPSRLSCRSGSPARNNGIPRCFPGLHQV